MAERYGTIPKAFTKAWWKYFWYYYKIPTIVILIAIFALSFTIYHNATAVKYDFTLVYTSNRNLTDEELCALSEKVADIIPDIDGNGEKNVQIKQIVFNESVENPEYTQTVVQKLQLEFVTENSMLFLFSDDKGPYLFDDVNLSDAFCPASRWCDETTLENKKLYFHKGESYGVSLPQTIQGTNINSELFAAVRTCRNDNEDALKKAETAKLVASALVNN